MKGLLAILFLAAQAQAATLYVSLTGSHDTNAPAFSTWEAAATNIQSAIDAASAGDTVRVAPGTYPAAVTINKNSLTVQGGHGTLWDADRTIIDRQGAANSVGVTFSGATNSTLRGFTVMGSTAYGIQSLANGSNTIDSCVIRGNVAIKPVDVAGAVVRNCIVVGNTSRPSYTYRAAVCSAAKVQSSIIEANDSNNSTPFSLRDVAAIRNSIYVNSYECVDAGGNITNATFTTTGTGSVCQIYNIAPASSGSGSNLQWAGVAAYIPRIGSLAQGAGVGYPGIAAAKSGDGGPALWPIGAKFLGCDSSTNLNHGAPSGGVSYSTNSPFSGGGSATFDGASGYVDIGKSINASLINSSAITLEAFAFNRNTASTRGILIVQADTGAGAFIVQLNGTIQVAARSQQSDTAQWANLGINPTNAWVHYAAVIDYQNSRIIGYANGAAVVTQSVSFSRATYGGAVPSTESSAIGANKTAGTQLWQGEISEARIWNVARSPAEIAASYTNRLTGTEAGLVGYWRLDETETPITTGPFNLRNPTLQPTFMEAF